MSEPPVQMNEYERLKALYSMRILDTPAEEFYDRMTRLGQQVFSVETTLISLVDTNRQWFKSMVGFHTQETHRNLSFCAHAINTDIQTDEDQRIFEVCDAQLDSRFSDNPLVTGEPVIRFYIAYILQSSNQKNVGTYCLIDSKPRNFSAKERLMLVDLGALIQDKFNDIEACNEIIPSFENIITASHCAKEVLREMTVQLRKHGVSLNEWRLLDYIGHSRFATPTKASDYLGIATPQISKVLDLLESKHLIIRTRPNLEDRRVVQLFHEKRGLELWRTGEKLSTKVLDKSFKH